HILILESRCNLVIYSKRNKIWETPMVKNIVNCYAKLQNDGNFVIYSYSNNVIWANN
ncbi:hypothetical protein SELMODRAFT_18052, partial [Selaginella moellendorffii]